MSSHTALCKLVGLQLNTVYSFKESIYVCAVCNFIFEIISAIHKVTLPFCSSPQDTSKLLNYAVVLDVFILILSLPMPHCGISIECYNKTSLPNIYFGLYLVLNEMRLFDYQGNVIQEIAG